MILSPFEDNVVCVKCGYNKADSKYVDDTRILALFALVNPEVTQPVIERKCKRCFYTWFQKPLDWQ